MPVSTLGGGGSSQKSQVHVFPPTPSIDTHQTSPGQMPVWTAPDDRKEIGVSGPDNARHIRSNVPEAFSRAFSELPTIHSEFIRRRPCLGFNRQAVCPVRPLLEKVAWDVGVSPTPMGHARPRGRKQASRESCGRILDAAPPHLTVTGRCTRGEKAAMERKPLLVARI